MDEKQNICFQGQSVLQLDTSSRHSKEQKRKLRQQYLLHLSYASFYPQQLERIWAAVCTPHVIIEHSHRSTISLWCRCRRCWSATQLFNSYGRSNDARNTYRAIRHSHNYLVDITESITRCRRWISLAITLKTGENGWYDLSKAVGCVKSNPIDLSQLLQNHLPPLLMNHTSASIWT